MEKRLKLNAAAVELLRVCSRAQLVAALVVASEKVVAAFEREQMANGRDALDAESFAVGVHICLVKAINEAGKRMLAEDAERGQREPTAEEQQQAADAAAAAIAKASSGGSVPGNGTVH